MRNDHLTVVAPLMVEPAALGRQLGFAMAAIVLATTVLGTALALAWGASPLVLLLVGVLGLGWLPGLDALRRQLVSAESL